MVENPIEFKMDAAQRMRVAAFSGIINEQDVISAYAALMAEPDYDPSINDLVDLREVRRLDINAHGMQRIVELFTPLDKLDVYNRLAIVAPRDELYGMARMYQTLRSDAPEETRIFRNYDEAVDWLNARP